VFNPTQISIYEGPHDWLLLPEFVSGLKKAIYNVVTENVPESRIAVAFSGGVDSSLLAKICQNIGKQTALLTVGFAGSHDIMFSKQIATKLGLEQKILEINYSDFQRDLVGVRKLIKCENVSHIENCIAYFYICQLAQQNGLQVVLSANGCDELFCGYNGYRAVYDKGANAIMNLMDEKIGNELTLMREIALVASEFGVQMRQPFLSKKFVEFSKTIPIDQKIRGPDDMIRKHILREVALLMELPKESAMKPKKALQYGSLIHKNFKKIDI
jgi:asparagine synthase (glutamine-hydrolysing)